MGVLLTRVLLNSLVHSYLPTDDHALVYWPEEDCICQKQSLCLLNDPINRAVNILVIDTLKRYYNFLYWRVKYRYTHGHTYERMCEYDRFN